MTKAFENYTKPKVAWFLFGWVGFFSCLGGLKRQRHRIEEEFRLEVVD